MSESKYSLILIGKSHGIVAVQDDFYKCKQKATPQCLNS